MKFIFLKAIFLWILLVLLQTGSSAQIKYQYNKSRNESSWFAGINGGMTSYYGNLAVFNRDPLLKLSKESKPAIGITAGKSINRFFNVRLYAIYGGLKAQNNDSLVLYNAKLTAVGGQVQLQFATLFGGLQYIPDYGVYGIAGIGVTSVNPSISTIPNEHNDISMPIDSLNYTDRVSTFDFSLGIGGSYAIFDHIDINLEAIYHITFSEELDLYTGKRNDHYLHLNLGIIYRFGF